MRRVRVCDEIMRWYGTCWLVVFFDAAVVKFDVGDGDEETCLEICGGQRMLCGRFWARHFLRKLSVLGPTPDNLFDFDASRKSSVETSEELVEAE